MIKITMNDVLTATPVLRELANKPFKGSVTFKIARLIRELDKETSLFEQSKAAIGERYGMKDENGTLVVDDNGMIKLQEDKLEECNAELLSLLTTEIEINVDKLSYECFEDIEISPIQAIALDSLIDY